MSAYRARVSLDMNWEFEVEGDDDEDAYESLWTIIGYDAEGLVDTPHEPNSEHFIIDLKRMG